MRGVHGYIGLGFLTLTSCFFEYHPYEMRLESSMRDINAKAVKEIKGKPASDTLRIVLIADTQRAYDNLERIVNSANQLTYDFALMAGDITEYGLEQEYRWVHESLRRLKQPYVAAIGNHDYQGEGRHLFKKMYGPLNDRFVHGNFNIVLHDTNSRENNFSGNVPDASWLSTALADERYTHIVLGHVAPFSDDFDQSLRPGYEQVLKDNKVLIAIYGHNHVYEVVHLGDSETTVIVCPSPDKGFFLTLSVWATGFELEEIYYQ